jgi:hypothetical protein
VELPILPQCEQSSAPLESKQIKPTSSVEAFC